MAVRVEERAELRKHLISLEEYERMIEADVFETEARLELIRGEIVEMTSPGPAHEVMVARLHRLFAKFVGDAGLIWPQGNSIRLPQSKSRPQPDLTILRWRDDLYAEKRPHPDDVILLVEVSDSTLAFLRTYWRMLCHAARHHDRSAGNSPGCSCDDPPGPRYT
jgi:Uma2 family endonuclease